MLENISTTDLLIISGAVVFLYILMYPQFQMRSARRRRIGSIRAMEEKWGTKVLTMIHRKEAISMFGVPVYQYIDIEDAEEILRGIREAKEKPIDLIIHTPGGHLHASIQIARALKNHTAKTRVFVPHYSMSGGTLIALGADEIIMDKAASLGPVDPQIGDLLRGVFPAPSWLHVARKKGLEADDVTLMMGDISEKALNFTRDVLNELLDGKFDDRKKQEQVVDKLSGGEMIHAHLISAEDAKKLGLPVSTELPPEIHEFMKNYRAIRPNVEYVTQG
ncbi:MAG: ATP-dependent Clp protease proteolytic subunit [Candidatus Methanoperedenaceae archaeon]|nr:ATP-dependent Clp protease proteolytic subunit [Candidatus Methanoperedenaceae archaeon]MDW7726205.1 ATP-dependent Clp protease proteolytic subunit [Candidatus Methanoperedens sp.]